MQNRVWLIIVAVTLSVTRVGAQQALDIQMRLTKTTVLLGEPVWVDVTVTNRGGMALRIDMGADCFGNRPLKAEIPNAGPGIAQNERTCYQGFAGSCVSSGPSLLEAGDSLNRRYVLEGDFRITHPGNYRVLLEKTVSYAIAPPDEKPPSLMRNPVDQSAKDQLLLRVEPADAVKLLNLEQTLAAEATKPMPQVLPTAVRMAPSNPDALRKAQEALNEKQLEALEARQSLAEGLAEYPAVGMEPVFNEWMISGTVNYGLKALSNLNTPEARRMVAQAADPSQDLYLRWRQHFHVADTQKVEKMTQESFANWRAMAIHVLARRGDQSYMTLLEKLAGNSSAEVRQQAILGLGLLGGEAELPKLVHLAQNGASEMDRQDAIQAMGDTTSLKAVPILIDLFTLPNADQPSSSDLSLMTITHHSLPPARQRTLAEYRTMWQQWWERNKGNVRAYGPFECSAEAQKQMSPAQLRNLRSIAAMYENGLTSGSGDRQLWRLGDQIAGYVTGLYSKEQLASGANNDVVSFLIRTAFSGLAEIQDLSDRCPSASIRFLKQLTDEQGSSHDTKLGGDDSST